jgi:hypothetical protein
MERASSLRRKDLGFAKTCSMGWRSGKCVGRKINLAPAARLPDRFAFVAAEVVDVDDVAVLSVGKRTCSA